MPHALIPHLPSIPFFNSTTVRLISRAFTAHVAMPLAARLAPSWTVRTLAQRFITPPRIAHSEREKRVLNVGTPAMIASPMGALAAWRFGALNAPTIIMSHGWGGRGAQFREFVPALLDAGYAVWLFDHVSHGFSKGNEAPITDFARGVIAVTRHAQQRGDTIAGFVGHSLGCAGIGIALRDDSGITLQRDSDNPLVNLDEVRVVQIAPPASLIRYSRFFARALGIPERIRRAMQWRLEQKIGVSWDRFEMPGAVENMRAKSLVIHDQADREVLIASGLTVARAWPDARFKRTFGLGHRRVLRDASVIAATVDFLRDRVEFAPPPAVDAWSQCSTSLQGVAPLY